MTKSKTKNQEQENTKQSFLFRPLSIFLAGILCLILPVSALAPRSLAFAPAILGVLFFSLCLFNKEKKNILNAFYLILVLGVSSLAFISSFWSLNADFAQERSWKIFSVLLGGLCLFSAMKRIPHQISSLIAKLFPLALCLSMSIILFELLSGGWIHHTWRGTQIQHEYTNLSMLNRAVVLLTLFIPISIQYLALSATESFRKYITTLTLLLACAIWALTHSQSSHIAALVIAIFWFLFPYGRTKIWPMLNILLCVGIISMPWSVQFLYNHLASHMLEIPWLANAYAADRLEIWDFVARKALEQPFYGFGIEATRHVEHFETMNIYTPDDHVLHPHNVVLQIWIEFGLPGIVGLMSFTTALIYKISKLQSRTSQRLCLCVFMAVSAVSCTAYGFWQGWWLGLITLLAALCAHLETMQKKDRQSAQAL